MEFPCDTPIPRSTHDITPVQSGHWGGHPQEGYQCSQPQESCYDHSGTLIGYDDHSGTRNQAEPEKCAGSPPAYESSPGGNIEIDDHREAQSSAHATEASDSTAIYALQEQLFNSVDHNDNSLQTAKDLKAHLTTASLNINGLNQQKFLSYWITSGRKK